MELKLCPVSRVFDLFFCASNRTNLELKHSKHYEKRNEKHPSNRTSLELKPTYKPIRIYFYNPIAL